MTNDKLFKKLGTLLETAETAEAADDKHIKKLRKVLRKLKKNQNALTASLEGIEDSHERRKVKQEIEVLKLQRKKGVAIYKDLKRKQPDAGQ